MCGNTRTRRSRGVLLLEPLPYAAAATAAMAATCGACDGFPVRVGVDGVVESLLSSPGLPVERRESLKSSRVCSLSLRVELSYGLVAKASFEVASSLSDVGVVPRILASGDSALRDGAGDGEPVGSTVTSLSRRGLLATVIEEKIDLLNIVKTFLYDASMST